MLYRVTLMDWRCSLEIISEHKSTLHLVLTYSTLCTYCVKSCIVCTPRRIHICFSWINSLHSFPRLVCHKLQFNFVKYSKKSLEFSLGVWHLGNGHVYVLLQNETLLSKLSMSFCVWHSNETSLLRVCSCF